MYLSTDILCKCMAGGGNYIGVFKILICLSLDRTEECFFDRLNLPTILGESDGLLLLAAVFKITLFCMERRYFLNYTMQPFCCMPNNDLSGLYAGVACLSGSVNKDAKRQLTFQCPLLQKK